MSAIGSYAVVLRNRMQGCLDLAQNVRIETMKKWFVKKTQVVGAEKFHQEWLRARIREVPFDHSGYVLGNYLDAQQAINGIHLVDERSETARVLCKIFTAAFVFESSVTLPELAVERLLKFCNEEYSRDAAEMVEAVTAAHLFYRRGLAEITPEHLVIFLIQ